MSKQLSPELKQVRNSLSVPGLITYLKVVFTDEYGSPIVLRFTDIDTHDWFGETWSHSPFVMAGMVDTSSGEKIRPKINLPNENGAYTGYIQQGLLELADVTRYQALPQEAGGALTQRKSFYISRIVQLTSVMFTAELRKYSDGNKMKIPSGRYVSPEFSAVIR